MRAGASALPTRESPKLTSVGVMKYSRPRKSCSQFSFSDCQPDSESGYEKKPADQSRRAFVFWIYNLGGGLFCLGTAFILGCGTRGVALLLLLLFGRRSGGLGGAV